MPRIAKPLTETQVRNAKPRGKSYKLFDGAGLFLEVPDVGNRRWRFKYRFEGKEKLLAFGLYPEISLADARARRDDARKLVRNGQDPSVIRREQKAAGEGNDVSSFRAIAEEWLSKKQDTWTAYHLGNVRSSLERDVYPSIGDKSISTIQPTHILAIVRAVETRGALDVAARVIQRCSNILRYGVMTGRCTSNPAAELRGVVKQRKVTHRAAISRAEIPEFLTKLESYDGRPETRIGLRLLMLTFVRTNELRGARWSEINFDSAEWRIPAERMKMNDEHIVPLAKQSISALRELQKFTGYSELMFPGADGIKPISENTMLYALYRMGYHGRATGHGFRALASTCLNELGWKGEVIERQLAHAERNKVRAAYNRAQYVAERRLMMQAWADFIDAQRSGKVVALKRKNSG
jgi:integrase